MYSVGYVVTNIVILCLVTDGYYIYGNDQFIMCVNVEPLCCIPETDMSIVFHLKIFFEGKAF